MFAEGRVAATKAATDGKQAVVPVRDEGMRGFGAGGPYAERLAFPKVVISRYPFPSGRPAFAGACVATKQPKQIFEKGM